MATTSAVEVPEIIFGELKEKFKAKEGLVRYISLKLSALRGQFKALFFLQDQCVVLLQESKRISRLVLVFQAPDDDGATNTPLASRGRMRLLEPALIISGGFFRVTVPSPCPEKGSAFVSDVRFVSGAMVSFRFKQMEMFGYLVARSAQISKESDFEQALVFEDDLRRLNCLYCAEIVISPDGDEI